VIRKDEELGGAPGPFPRTRGGDPVTAEHGVVESAFSPHTRG